MKSEQVPFFLYWPDENAQFCINSIGHLGWLSCISNFPRFHKNVDSLERLKCISENSSQKGSFWRNKRKFEFSDLSSDSPYLQAEAYCLQADSKITLTPSRHQIHSKAEMRYATLGWKYFSQKYFQPKIGRKLSIYLASAENKNILIKKFVGAFKCWRRITSPTTDVKRVWISLWKLHQTNAYIKAYI